MGEQLTFDIPMEATAPARPRRRVSRRPAASSVQLAFSFVAVAASAVQPVETQIAPVAVEAPAVGFWGVPVGSVALFDEVAWAAPAAPAPTATAPVQTAGWLTRLTRAWTVGAALIALLLALVAGTVSRPPRSTFRQNDDAPVWHDRPRHKPPPTGRAVRAPRHQAVAAAINPSRGATESYAHNRRNP